MAQPLLNLQPPPSFDFATPDDWPRWRRRFEQFRSASDLSTAAAGKQIGTLLYCLGEEAESVLISVNATADDRKDYDKVLQLFDGYFQVRRNVIFERARFNRRAQQPGETAEQYIMALYNLVATCNYGDLEQEMIRDRLVVGIRDSGLSETLQSDADLTLEKAKQKIRQREAIHEQQQVLKGGEAHKPGNLDALHNPSSRRRYNSHQRDGSTNHTKGAGGRGRPRESKQCTRCGKGQHTRDKCPAKDATCHRCQRKGHYSSQCFAKTIAPLKTGKPNNAPNAPSSLETAFLDSTTSEQEIGWFANIQIGDQETLTFKLDTGAEVTAISDSCYYSLSHPPMLKNPQKVLYGPSRHPLQVVGQCHSNLSFKGRVCKQQVFVVTSLHLAQRLDATSCLETSLNAGDISKRFPNLFTGLGNLGEEYSIQLKPDATPYSLYTPRNVPLPLRGKVTEELERMEAMGVISKVQEPTAWCAGMVVVPKKSGAIRICVDLKPLNQSVLREVHPLPKVDETLAQLTGARVFSKLDANSGFWQIPLSPASRLLTTFITPAGRYCFNKLPFGISSAPEHFQRRMSSILHGLQGVLCHMDDVLVFGRDQQEHDERLIAALQRIQAAGATLNPEKCEFSKTGLKFLGHCIDQDGIRADPEKTAAIRHMKAPTTVPELRRFMGMVNQLGKFSPNLAQLTQPLRELLSKSRSWQWGPAQEEALSLVKAELSKPTTLALYDPAKDHTVSADASSFGLGAVLLQKDESGHRPVAFASRSMTETERRYAQIEKEALAITWAFEKFSTYILGKSVSAETDHKPLVPLLGTKQLDSLPARVLRFRLHLDRFNYSIKHVPGKHLYTADTLSRSPLTSTEGSSDLEELAELAAAATVAHLPASTERLETYRREQKVDPTCLIVRRYCQTGWPEQGSMDPLAKPFWEKKGELTVSQELLLCGTRIVVPASLREETMVKLHQGHQGVQRSRLRANTSVWWPGISNEIVRYVKNCSECSRDAKPNKEPLIPTPLPDHPWQKVGSDLLTLDGSTYLLVVDYFSRYPEVIQLRKTTTQSVTNALRSIFSRHGIPETLVSDNGPQYSSEEFRAFASRYGFAHVTSSPRYPQSNGLAERTVKTVKKLLKESSDPHLSLLSYRATPLPWCKLSPAELLMGRRVRTDVPITGSLLTPQWKYIQEFRDLDKEKKRRQKRDFDQRHRTRPLPDIPDDTNVWVTTGDNPVPARTIQHANTPRSYIVSTPHGNIRRNRSQVNVAPAANPQDPPLPTRDLIMTRSRTGTSVIPPQRLT